jgi:hypothetical protein
MESVLTDLHKLDGAMAAKGIAYAQWDQKNEYYVSVLKKHGINQAIFDSSVVYYNRDPKKFERIYDNVIKNLTDLQTDVNKGKYHDIDSSEIHKIKYNIWNGRTKWGTDFASSDPGEVLFELVNLTVDGVGKESVAYLCWQAGYDDYCLTSSFYELMQEDPDDVRNQAYTVVPKTKRAYIAKYQPQSGKAVEDSNIPVLRLSELYLIAAEAAVKLNNNDKAVKYLDAIVSRANPEKTVQGKTVTLDDVLLERRKELFGEGHRFFDALRNHQTIVRKESTKEFPEIAETSHLKMVDESVSFDWNYYRVVLPIPKAEMNSNPNMQQNPTYGD